MTHLTGVIGAVSIATNCFLSTDSETGRVIGVINTGGPVATVIEAPDTVWVGVAFAAAVNSYGNSCTAPDGVKLTLAPAEARVIPFDRVPDDDDGVCADVLRRLPHPVELRFTALGAATIVAEGMMYGADFEQVRGTVTKAVVVVP